MNLRLVVALALLVCGCVVTVSAPLAQGYRDVIDCESRNYGYERCEVPWRDARLVRQLSDTACVRGRNWGIDRRGIWVDRGCAGRFAPAGRHHGDRDDYAGGWRPGPGWDHRFAVRCDSRDYQYRFCSVDLGRGGRAYLSRQISGSPCIEGRTWGWNRAGIWVNQGCDAEFTIDRRWR
jgi:Protein of unknown function (DUF3011)